MEMLLREAGLPVAQDVYARHPFLMMAEKVRLRGWVPTPHRPDSRHHQPRSTLGRLASSWHRCGCWRRCCSRTRGSCPASGPTGSWGRAWRVSVTAAPPHHGTRRRSHRHAREASRLQPSSLPPSLPAAASTPQLDEMECLLFHATLRHLREASTAVEVHRAADLWLALLCPWAAVQLSDHLTGCADATATSPAITQHPPPPTHHPLSNAFVDRGDRSQPQSSPPLAATPSLDRHESRSGRQLAQGEVGVGAERRAAEAEGQGPATRLGGLLGISSSRHPYQLPAERAEGWLPFVARHYLVCRWPDPHPAPHTPRPTRPAPPPHSSMYWG